MQHHIALQDLTPLFPGVSRVRSLNFDLRRTWIHSIFYVKYGNIGLKRRSNCANSKLLFN